MRLLPFGDMFRENSLALFLGFLGLDCLADCWGIIWTDCLGI